MNMILFQFWSILLMNLNGYIQVSPTNTQDYSRLNREESNIMLMGDTSVFGALPQELHQYYHYINLAARAIYRNDFAEASILYDTAFLHKMNPFYVDLANYVRVNHKCGKPEKNDLAIRQILVDKHVDTARLFLHLPKRLFSKSNLALIKDLSRKARSAPSVHAKMDKALREIWSNDQGVRAYDRIPDMSREEVLAMYARRDSVDSVQVILFKHLVQTYGFPDEQRIGVDYDDSLSWNSALYVLLLHFMSAESVSGRMELIGIIRDAMHEGQWNSSLAAPLLDRLNIQTGQSMGMGLNFMYTSVYLVMDKLYRPFVFYTDSLMQVANLNRQAIGLDSFHIAQRQAVCQYMASLQYDKTDMVIMLPWAAYDELPPGLVKQAAKEANVDAESYRINTDKIMGECKCEEKRF